MTSIICEGGAQRGQNRHVEDDGFAYAICPVCAHDVSCTQLGVIRPHLRQEAAPAPLSQLSLFDAQLTLF